AVDQGGLAENGLPRLQLRLLHFQEQVVAFASALAHACETTHATMSFRDVVDELLNEYGLTHARSAEQADLAALTVRSQEVDDFDAGFEHLDVRRLFDECGRCPMNGQRTLELNRPRFVYRLAHHVHDASQGACSDRHADGRPRVFDGAPR